MPHPPYAFDSLMYIADRPRTVFVEGRGSWLKDRDGKSYLDFVQGWAVNSLGHCPEPVVKALQAQAARLINPSPAFYNEPALRLADLIARHSGLGKIFFANSGAEANEGAIKLARKWGQKFRGGAYEIVTMENAFHGRTLATMSASGKPQWRDLFEPKVPGFPKVPLNDLEAAERAISDKTVAVMLEPVQGEAGVIPATPAFLAGLREITKKRGILLILDEVQAGMGRTGKLFAHQHFGVQPDILTLGKGIGGGVPLAAMVAREEVCCFEPGDQGGTYNGNPLDTSAGCAVMDAITQPGFLDEVTSKGAHLRSRLQAISDKYGMGEVRGLGLLLALDLQREIGAQVVKESFDRGLLLNSSRPNSLRFMPALTVSRDEIDQMAAILDGVIGRIPSGA